MNVGKGFVGRMENQQTREGNKERWENTQKVFYMCKDLSKSKFI